MSQQPAHHDPNREEFGCVLIVDDNQDIVELLDRTLRSHTQFQTLTALSGEQALERVEESRIDIIILDMLMPGISGIEFFKIIKERSMHIPVIFLTGRGDEELKREALQLGAFDFLSKPIRARDLLLLIDEAYRTVCKIKQILAKASA
jgi:DNA-binding NtrC family response regulator